MTDCGFNQPSNLIVIDRENDQVGNAVKPAVLDRVHFLLRVTVAMTQPGFGIIGDLIGAEKSAYRICERRCAHRVRDFRGVRRIQTGLTVQGDA